MWRTHDGEGGPNGPTPNTHRLQPPPPSPTPPPLAWAAANPVPRAAAVALASARVDERIAALGGPDVMAAALHNCFRLLARLEEVENMVRVLQLVSVLVEVRRGRPGWGGVGKGPWGGGECQTPVEARMGRA